MSGSAFSANQKGKMTALEQGNTSRTIIGKTKDWIEAGDPIISAAFDVATGRRMLELSEDDLALKFLGQNGALREIKRSISSGFLTEKEAHRLEKKLDKILKSIKENELNDPWRIDSILHELRNIQIFLDKRHYFSFVSWLSA